MKIVVGVPCRDEVHTTFAYDLAMAISTHNRNHPDDEIVLSMKRGTLIADQRHDLAKQALLEEADYLLMLDSDMRFPHDIIHHMVSRDKDILAACSATRKHPAKTNAFRSIRPSLNLWIDKGSKGLHEVAAVGTAIMLIKTEVFFRMDLPFFEIVWDDYFQHFMGEDVYFCAKARQAGFKVWVDQDLSHGIRHTGSYEFSHEDAIINKEDDEEVVKEFIELRKVLDERDELRRTEVDDS